MRGPWVKDECRDPGDAGGEISRLRPRLVEGIWPELHGFSMLPVKCERRRNDTLHRPRSRRRPLSATQHHPTTSLVGISWHCNEPRRFVSSIFTAFVTATHYISMACKKRKKIK